MAHPKRTLWPLLPHLAIARPIGIQLLLQYTKACKVDIADHCHDPGIDGQVTMAPKRWRDFDWRQQALQQGTKRRQQPAETTRSEQQTHTHRDAQRHNQWS